MGSVQSVKEEYAQIFEEYLQQYPNVPPHRIGKLVHQEKLSHLNEMYVCNMMTHYVKQTRSENELLISNVNLKKQTQKFQDTNRIERKAFREFARIENAISEYAKEIVNQNKKFGKKLSKITVPKIKKSKDQKYIGVIQLADWHANELIELPNNKYDFQVLAARAKKLVDESVRMFKAYGITSILIAHVGDMLNSDRRMDELLSQATNRAKASVLITYVLQQMIMDLRQHFEISIVSVMGNESRVKGVQFHTNNNIVSDNYDFTIFANLKQMFEFAGIDGVNFGEIDQMETVVNVGGQNWLVIHDIGKISAKQKDVQSKIGAYRIKGINIDHILAGHTHATRNTDLVSRSSSMAGSNEFNENTLGLIGKSAQNIHIAAKDFRITAVIDLQNSDPKRAYKIIEELETYNAKSHSKTRTGTTILKIKI